MHAQSETRLCSGNIALLKNTAKNMCAHCWPMFCSQVCPICFESYENLGKITSKTRIMFLISQSLQATKR